MTTEHLPNVFFGGIEISAASLCRTLRIGCYHVSYDKEKQQLTLTSEEAEPIFRITCAQESAERFARDFGYNVTNSPRTSWSVFVPRLTLHHDGGKEKYQAWRKKIRRVPFLHIVMHAKHLSICSMKSPSLTSVLLLACGILLGAGSMFFFMQQNLPPITDATIYGKPLRDTNTTYTYIKPLLACNVSALENTTEYQPLHDALQVLIDDATTQGFAESVTVHFRDLDAGLWTSIGSNEQYAPGSLMKVPILIAYLKQAELNPAILTKVINVLEDPTPGVSQAIAPEKTVIVGESYTIEELLKLMLIHSDNRAMVVLMNYVDIETLHEILDDLGIPIPQEGADYVISPRTYSRLFRILYNGTYLQHDQSEQALAWLAAAEYANGLRGDISSDIPIAHKFGESSTTLKNGTVGHELHDCGIVYTDTPYLLCMMTRGAQVEELEHIMQNLSNTTYQIMNTTPQQ